MRFSEFSQPHKQDDQIDEILPALGAIAGAAARGIASAAVRKGAKTLAKGAARKAASTLGKSALAKAGAQMGMRQAGKALARSAVSKGEVDVDPQDKNSDPNATIGTQDTQPTNVQTKTSQGSKGTEPTQSPSAPRIKSGQNLKLPSQTSTGKPGPEKNFRVNKITKGREGDEVEIINPLPKPGEPKKFVFKKDDLERIMSNEVE